MSDESGKQISPATLLVLAVIGGGGTNLGINALVPPDAPDRYTGTEAKQRNSYVDEKLSDMKAHIESMNANQVRYWTAMLDHINAPWHDGAEIRLNQHDNDMARLERLVDDRCNRVPEHTHQQQQRQWNQNYSGGK